MRRIISLASGSPGTTARLPLLVGANISSRNNTLKPACFFTPPWQAIHFLLRIGFTSALKSIFFPEPVRKQPARIAANKHNRSHHFFGAKRFILALSLSLVKPLKLHLNPVFAGRN